MTVFEILEARYTKDRTEYTIKFKPVPGKRLGAMTKEDITIASVSDGNKEDYEVIDYAYTNKNGGSITIKTEKDPITAEIMIKFKDNEEEYSIDTREKLPTEETRTEETASGPATAETSTETSTPTGEVTPQPAGETPVVPPTEVHEETRAEDTVEMGRPASPAPAIEEPAYPPVNRFYNPEPVKKEFKPIPYEIYFKDEYDTTNVATAEEAYLLLRHFEQGDFIMREGNEFIMYTGEGAPHGNIFMVCRNMTRREFEEYFHVQKGLEYHMTYTFRVKKEHPEAVTKPFKLELGFYRHNDLTRIDDFTIEFSPVNHALVPPVPKNNKKQAGPVFEVPVSNNFTDTIMNIFLEKNDDYFELVKWTTEGYNFLIPFRNPAVIRYVSCYPHEAPNRAKRFIGFVQVRSKFPGEFTIVWTIKGKNGAVTDVRQPVKITGRPSPTDGMTPDEIAEWTIYGSTAEERDKWFCYRSLSRRVRVTGRPETLNKFNMPSWQHRSVYRPQENVINTDCLRLKEFFDKYPNETVGIISYYWIPMGLTAKQFVEFLSKHQSGEGKEYSIKPPYYRTWEEYEYGRKNEIDYRKMAEEMNW